jgi:hypothetical protein
MLLTLQHVLQGLINLCLPALAAHLHAHSIHPTMYASQWFLTLFAYSYPFPFCTRVLDAFCCEGWKAVFRIALALLQHNQAKLLSCTKFETLMVAFRTMPQYTFPDLCSNETDAPSIKHYRTQNDAGSAADGEGEGGSGGSGGSNGRGKPTAAGAGGPDHILALAYTSSVIRFKRRDMESLAIEKEWIDARGTEVPRSAELCGADAGSYSKRVPAAFKATDKVKATVASLGLMFA